MEITPETKIKDLISKDYEIEGYNVFVKEVGETNFSAEIKFALNKKFKTIDDYGKKLSDNKGLWVNAIKDNFPRQYYSIILQMIADEICEEGIERRYIIAGHLGYIFIRSVPLHANYLGTVKFDTEKHAEQARDILGDKIEYLL